MNPGGRGCSEPRWRHCTPAWATRAKLHLKKKRFVCFGRQFWGLGADATYKQQQASALLNRSIAGGTAEQYRGTPHYQAQEAHVKQVCGGHPEDTRQGGPSTFTADAQADEDDARHLRNRNHKEK